MHLTLLVPELIWPEPPDQLALGNLAAPGFAWLAGHARRQNGRRRPFETVLASLFGLDPAPFGALRLLGEGSDDARNGHWLCADPVHLRFHQECIILADAGAFDLEDDEARSIGASLNAEFADVGEFHIADARRWYLRLNAPVDHVAAPLSAVAGRRVDGESAGSALPLTRWLNEVQMFLHGHPVNAARQASGKPAINSLWLWGGGTLPEQPAAAFSAVFSDNPLADGLARSSGIPVHRRPADPAALLAQGGERPLVVLDQLLPCVLYEDADGWRAAFERIEADWFVTLKNALGGKVAHISLIAPTIYGELHYTLAAGERWKFWKSGRPIAELASELAGAPAA